MSSESLPCHSHDQTGHLWFLAPSKPLPSSVTVYLMLHSLEHGSFAWFFFFLLVAFSHLKSQTLPWVYISLTYSGQQWSGLLWSSGGSFPLLTTWKCFENCSSVYTCVAIIPEVLPMLVIFHKAGHCCENPEVGIRSLSCLMWSWGKCHHFSDLSFSLLTLRGGRLWFCSGIWMR